MSNFIIPDKQHLSKISFDQKVFKDKQQVQDFLKQQGLKENHEDGKELIQKKYKYEAHQTKQLKKDALFQQAKYDKFGISLKWQYPVINIPVVEEKVEVKTEPKVEVQPSLISIQSFDEQIKQAIKTAKKPRQKKISVAS